MSILGWLAESQSTLGLQVDSYPFDYPGFGWTPYDACYGSMMDLIRPK